MGTSPYGCCPEGCGIASDVFDRADLGCSWDVRSGDWSISSGRLREAGAADALIVHTLPHPKDDWTCIAEVELVGIVQNVTYFLVVHYLDDSNYDFASYTYDGTNATVAVGQMTGGTESVLDSVGVTGPPESGNETLSICCNIEGIEAGISSQAAVAWSCDAVDGGGRRAGVRSKNSGPATPIEFDNFVFKEHYVTNPACPHCLCDCQDNCIAPTLVTKFTATGDCAACLDGLEFESTLSGSRTEKQYEWAMQLPEIDPCNGSYYTEWSLHCEIAGSTACEEWPLVNKHYYLNEGDWEGGIEYPDPDTCSCNPFTLIYGPFEIARPGAGIVCTYWITITEKA